MNKWKKKKDKYKVDLTVYKTSKNTDIKVGVNGHLTQPIFENKLHHYNDANIFKKKNLLRTKSS